MNEKTEKMVTEMEALAEHARALMSATADVAGEKAQEARKRLASALERRKEITAKARETVVESAKAVDSAVHEHPYLAIGIASGFSALLGFVAARLLSRNSD